MSRSTAEVRPVELPLVALVAHARAVPVEARVAFAATLRPARDEGRGLLVETCHRAELYVVADEARPLDLPEIRAGGRRLDGLEAARHLIAVACGLDSTVLGESQVLHQLREALATRRSEGRLEARLDRLVQIALRAGRAARAQLGGPPRSLADTALDRIEAHRPTGGSRARRILVVGAGAMGRLAATAAARRGHVVEVASRNPDRAATLARDVGGAPRTFASAAGLAAFDGVIVALSGPWPVGRSALVRLPGTSLVVDLSAPPALDPPTRDALGARLVTVDDLADEPGGIEGEAVRRRIGRIVDDALEDYAAWLRRRESASTIEAIAEHAEARRREELEWLRRRVPDLPPHAAAAVEQMSHRLVGGLLHPPLSTLNDDGGEALEPAARELFRV